MYPDPNRCLVHRHGPLWAALVFALLASGVSQANAQGVLTYFEAMERGTSALTRGRYEEAIARFDEAINAPLVREHPSEAYAGRAEACYQLGRYDEAIGDASEAIRLNSHWREAYIVRGWAWFNKGDFDRAVADQTEAIRLDPKDALVWGYRAEDYLKKGDCDRAIADYAEAIRLKPDEWSFYYNRGQTYMTSGDANLERGKRPDAIADFGNAIASYTEAIRLNVNAGSYCNRGVAYERTGRPEDAISDYTEAVQLDPNQALYHRNLAGAYRNRGETDKARSHDDRASQLEEAAKANQSADVGTAQATPSVAPRGTMMPAEVGPRPPSVDPTADTTPWQVERPSVSGNSIVTFSNRTGRPALVQLVGPTRAEVLVPAGADGSIQNVAPGRYRPRVRDGEPGKFTYRWGDPFDVEETDGAASHITITLHGVASGGNYKWHSGPGDN